MRFNLDYQTQNNLAFLQKLIFSSVFLLFCIASSDAQFNKEIGQWEAHLPYQIAQNITFSDEYLFYSTEGAIGRIDFEEISTTFFSKIDGLSEVGITEIAYDLVGDQLVIVYNSGKIDFLQEDNSIISIANFEQNVSFQDKTVNKVIVTDNRQILYATRFGVIAQNADNYLFDFTTNMETEVNELAMDDTKIYAATSEGIYTFELSGGENPADFTSWKLEAGDVNLPALYECTDIEEFNNNIYALIEGNLYEKANGNWNLYTEPYGSDTSFVFLSAEGNNLLIGSRYGNNSLVDVINSNGEFIPSIESCGNSIREAIELPDGSIWYADNWHGIRHQNEINGTCRFEFFNSPYSNKAREIRIKNSSPYIASGGINENFLFSSNRDGFFVKNNGFWSNYNGNTVNEINEKNMINFSVVVPHPSKDIIYAGAFHGGVLEINKENNQTTVYNSENSPILGTSADLSLERVPDMKFDENENLWIITYNADKPLHVLTPQGVWHSFSFGNRKSLGALEFDDYGNIWIPLVGSTGGVLVFNYNNSIADPTDDDYFVLNSSNSELPFGKVFSVKNDLDGDVWVGTQSGPVIFECGNVFPDKDCDGSVRTVLQDSIPAPLLGTEFISTITVDGANRKWLGTTTGIYVQSANGENQIYRFTTDNSPLFDNNIIDLEYDPVIGEIYIATDKGVQSLRIDATGAPKFFNEADIYTYPNPVRPGWEGPIAIRGLARDANVKITDMQGRLVFETTANGGTAVWDGRTYSGDKVTTGVYLVYATFTEDLTDIRTATTKILFVE